VPNSDDDPNSDPNTDLMAQLAGMAGTGVQLSDEDTLAVLNAEPEPDPLAGVEYTDDLPTDARAELNAVQQGFRDRARREEERFRLATDSEYWFVLCFKTREDKERFLTRAKLLALGDKYLDGYAAARVLGIPLDNEDDK
jgi:ribonuclease HI